MKPTSPEEREIEEAAAEVSARYREAANDEPSARIDAAILQAARAEAGRRRVRFDWRAPAAVAAVLVIGVSLSFMTREVIDPLPPLEQKQAETQMARPAAPSLAMKPEPAVKGKMDLGARPSRDRGDRADREAEVRPGTAESVEPVPSQAASNRAAEIASPPPAAAAPSPDASMAAAREARPQESRVGETLADSAAAKAVSPHEELAEKKAAPAEEPRRLRALRKEEVAGLVAPLPADEWVRRIETLVAQGRQADARTQLAELRKRYPDYRLPEALRALEPDPAAGRK